MHTRKGSTRPAAPRADFADLLRRWLVGLLALGLAWRLLRYFLRMPIWGDEASLCVNFLDRGYRQLMQPLANLQVAPLLFLWSEFTAFTIAGSSGLALRLLPVVAGCGALLLFWPLARLAYASLPEFGSAAVIATGMLAVSYYPVRHSCEVKPYSFDLLVAVILLLLGVKWLITPQARLPKLLLVSALPLAIGLSFPAIFVAGGILFALLPGAVQRGDRRDGVWLALYSAVMVATFLVLYKLNENAQLRVAGPDMASIWRNSFPPASPLKLLRWLVAVHTGNLMAYPVGGRHAGSVVTTFLFAAGVGALVWKRRYALLSMLLAPFALTLIAATMHRYPYGGSARVAQHLAPMICLLAGLGIEVILRTALPDNRNYQRATSLICLLFALIAMGGMVRDLRQPYKTIGDERVRELANTIFARPDAAVVVWDARDSVPTNFQWYLGRRGAAVAWSGRLDPARLQGTDGELWILSFQPRPGITARASALVSNAGLRYRLAKHFTEHLLIGRPELPPAYVEVMLWVPAVSAP